MKINAIQFILVLFLCPETRYLGPAAGGEKRSAFQRQYLCFRRLNPKPLTLEDFYRPLKVAKVIDIIVPTIAAAIVFNFATIYFTVELPPLFAARFDFNPEQTGLQFISLIVGFVTILVYD
jgi:hypothetical protein